MTIIKKERFNLERWFRQNPDSDPANWEQIEIPDWRDDWIELNPHFKWDTKSQETWEIRVWYKVSNDINGQAMKVYALVTTQSYESPSYGYVTNIVVDERDPKHQSKWTQTVDDVITRLEQRVARQKELNPDILENYL